MEYYVEYEKDGSIWWDRIASTELADFLLEICPASSEAACATKILAFVECPKNGDSRELDTVPFAHAFWVDGNEELCNATGYEVYLDGIWWGEFVDSNGDFHLGN